MVSGNKKFKEDFDQVRKDLEKDLSKTN